jgi:hypothetical protein
LIEREGYKIGDWNLTADGTCSRCGTPCAGVFETGPGSWGAVRRPVYIPAKELSAAPEHGGLPCSLGVGFPGGKISSLIVGQGIDLYVKRVEL